MWGSEGEKEEKKGGGGGVWGGADGRQESGVEGEEEGVGREREGDGGGGGGVIHRDRLSGKASGVRGEDLLFMLETGQGWAGGQCWDGPGIHLEWNEMV